MSEKKTGWENIPSLEGLGVDWEYTPENPLGKRAFARMTRKTLLDLLSAKSIPVKVVSTNYDKTGRLVDISPKGVAVELPEQLTVGQPTKIGFFLGKTKVISRTVVRNVTSLEKNYRIGLEFVGLEKETEKYIAELIAANFYKEV